MGDFRDFNNAKEQGFDVVPKGTIAKVRLTFRPGGYNDAKLGLIDGLAKLNPTTGSIYLMCEYVILNGTYAKRKVFSMIGVHSNKGPEWGEQGRSFIKAILNSAHNFKSSDNSEEAQQVRKLADLSELNGITFLAKIDVEKDQNGSDKNTIKIAVTPDSSDYYNDGVAVPVNGDGTPFANSAPTTDERIPFDDDIPF